MVWLWIILIILSLWIWWVLGFFWYKKTLTQKALDFKARMARVKEIEEETIEKAKKRSDETIEEARKKSQQIVDEWHKRADKIAENRQHEIDTRIKKMEQLEAKMVERESKMDEKLDKLEEEKRKIFEKQKEADEYIIKQKEKLEEISKLSPEDAKKKIFEIVEAENREEIAVFIEKFKKIKKEESDKEASMIIAQAMPRVASDLIAWYTTVSVDLPNEEFKWKLIWREWRNIAYFEKITWCEIVVDDTPLLVRLSCYDHEKRFVWVQTLEKLIKDTRINPFYIDKFYSETISWFDNILLDKWKEALNILNLPMMKPDLVKIIWQFWMRYSYGQNLRVHSIEVAKMCEAIASEMHIDPVLAKKAWLLHDIGKITAQWWESHALVGGDILRKFDIDPIIINAAESHHHDKPMIHPISRIVTAADAMSWSRPWARFNTRDMFIEKMTKLEKLISETTGVSKVHIMQAWREIMVFADPDKKSDIETENMIKEIANKIESQLDYPGIIRVTWIREKKIIQFVK